MKKNNAVLLSTPYILWMLVFTLIPLGVVGFYALTDVETGVFTFKNIQNLMLYMPALWRSILYSLISAVICLVIGYPVAYFMAHCKAATQKFLYMLVMLPMCMSFLLRTLAWVGLLQDTGIINSILASLGLGQLRLIRTPGAVILGMVYNYLPYMILPLSVPGILSGITMVFVPAVSTFYISQKLGGTETVLIGDVIEKQFKSARNPNMGAALSLVLMLLVFVCTGIMNRVGGDDEEGGVVV